MGDIYFCHDQKTGSDVAVKTIKDTYASNSSIRELFLAEAAKWILLGNHPNIVHAERFERLASTRQPALVIDWVKPPTGYPGASLFEIMKQRKFRPLPFKKTLDLVLGIVRGMRHAVACIPGLVHADLKPSNILIDQNWNPRITDFGVSQVRRVVADTASSLPMAQQPAIRTTGTPGYCAPEQLAKFEEIDQRADIFSVGIILYQLLTGLPLMRGLDEESIRQANLTGDFRDIPEALPPCIREIIHTCISVAREKRYPDWNVLDRALCACYRQISHEMPVIADNSSSGKVLDITRKKIAYLEIGKSYGDIGQYRQALFYLNLAYEEAKKSDDIVTELNALHSLGNIYLYLGDDEKAKDCLSKCLDKSRETGEILAEFDALSSLGALYSRQNQHGKALQLLKQAEVIASALGDPEARAVLLGNLGGALARSGDLASARDCFYELLMFSNDVNDMSLKARTLANLGVAEYDLKEFNLAESHLTEACGLLASLGDDPGRLHALEHLCKCYTALGQKQKGNRYCQEYEQLAELLRNRM